MDDLKENMGTVETTAASKHDFDYWSGLILQVISEYIFSSFIGVFSGWIFLMKILPHWSRSGLQNFN